jgi:hypothetical protein
MKGLFASLGLAVVSFGCGAGDDTADGTRAECAHGGALVSCPPAERTAQGACWRLVDCAVIPVKSDNDNIFDWGKCFDRIQSASDIGEQLIIDCIAASSCDQLQVEGSPHSPDSNMITCLSIGRGQ